MVSITGLRSQRKELFPTHPSLVQRARYLLYY